MPREEVHTVCISAKFKINNDKNIRYNKSRFKNQSETAFIFLSGKLITIKIRYQNPA